MENRFSIVITLLTVVSSLIQGDISNQNPPAGTCICIDGSSVNVRDAACGSVIGSASTGACYRSTGAKVGCTLSGVFYQFFELDYAGTSGWIAGDYLVIGSDTQCGGTVVEPDSEFRSLFIATVANIDWPTSSSNTVAEQQQQMLTYMNMMDSTNMNAIVFQIRPVGDAFYSSSIEPWSRYLTGTQGTAPSPFWDPLDFTITEAHNRGIEVHAWLNPYRANMAPNTAGLASNHMAILYPQYAYPYGNYLWMDPGAQVIIDHLMTVIQDILTRYDLDGIHFDDYFYPYPDGSNQFPDSATYQAYVDGGGPMSRDDWRRDNVNRMVQGTYSLVKSIKPNAKFSISPFGIYRPGEPEGMPPPIVGLDPYSELYADSKLWLQSGWVDFLAPQLYWEIDPPEQSYPTLLDWWLDANTASRHVYAANAVYRIVDNNWPVSEITNQIAISRDSVRRGKFSLGNIHFSAKYFRDNTKSITDIFRTSVYTKKATIPPMSWMGLSMPAIPKFVSVSGFVVSWSKAEENDETRWWVVMKKDASEWSVYDILPRGQLSVSIDEPGLYALKASNAASQMSDAVTFYI